MMSILMCPECNSEVNDTVNFCSNCGCSVDYIKEHQPITKIEDFEITNGTLVKYRGNDENILIPNNVTNIGQGAFSYCRNLRSVILPEGVTIIGDSTFSYCYNLKNVAIPNSLTTIGNLAFYCCLNLSKISIPTNVNSIGNFAFCYCINLMNITIPISVKNIGELAFFRCNKLNIKCDNIQYHIDRNKQRNNITNSYDDYIEDDGRSADIYDYDEDGTPYEELNENW